MMTFFYPSSLLLAAAMTVIITEANPESKPYIPFRTDPFDQGDEIHHKLEWEEDMTKSNNGRRFDVSSAANSMTHNERCPLQFSLGISSKLHDSSNAKGLGIIEPPVIFPILPAEGPGRQVLYTTQYEHLDMLKPVKGQQQMVSSDIVKEGLIQHFEFPLLFESSSFLTSPIIGDVNMDGILDAILADYDGGIYVIGLQVKDGQRWFHRTQVPRLYVRRKWMESMVNETLGMESIVSTDSKDEEISGEDEKPHDPYHSYFEYTYGIPSSHEDILRGVPAHVLGQEQDQVQTLEERRKRKVLHNLRDADGIEEAETFHADESHRRLQEVGGESDTPQEDKPGESDPEDEGQRLAAAQQIENNEVAENDDLGGGILGNIPDDAVDDGFLSSSDYAEEDDHHTDDHDDHTDDHTGDDYAMAREYYGGDDAPRTYHGDDDEYPAYDDYYGRYHNSEHDEYYHDKHYVRLPPHILCTPTLMEFPKLYSDNGETEHLLFVAVSYYLDEDEYEGFFSYKRFDETDDGLESEIKRGMYVSSAILVYQFADSAHRWGRQEHLDLSGDYSAPVNTTLVGSIPLKEDSSRLGAFALSSPTVADIDGDGEMEVLMGTSMGIVYCLDARNLYKKDSWPVQFNHAIQNRILVEDVRGDTNLEIFVADAGGNVVCLDHKANKIWHRDLLANVDLKSNGQILAASQMVLGDVDGDGVLDIVVVLKIRENESSTAHFLFALSADTGKDIQNFPLRLGNDKDQERPGTEEHANVEKLPAPLLVDLHADQTFLVDYLRRNGTKWSKSSKSKSGPSLGGSAAGLHIVLPVGSNLVIMEAGSGCTQSISIGEKILAMVQADDVHGTNSLDLVITTASGDIVTLASQSPYHPLSVWNNGETRGRWNAFAHGYSASQGIFVHDVSRQYRDIFGVYVPITFEIFDNRPNIMNEPDKRVYKVEIREGTVAARMRKTYTETGVYTERIYIPSGPGYYTLSVVLKSTHGIIYEDTFHIGYNVNYMSGFGILLWLPLVIGSVAIFLFGSTRTIHWDDDDYEGGDQNGGILGGTLPE